MNNKYKKNIIWKMWILTALVVTTVHIATTNGMLAPHPRLILTPERLAVVKKFIATNAQAQAYFVQLSLQGDYVLNAAPLPRPPMNASDILVAARSVLTRTTVTALLYRLTGDERYAARTVAELLSFTSWTDWGIVKHALDAGELSLAAAIGLDWTYDYLSAPTRSAAKTSIIAGIVAKSGEAFRAAYEEGPRGDSWWTCDASNWAQVTNGGCGTAALAILDEVDVPTWYTELLRNATTGILCSATAASGYGGGYAPDGAWWEGPIYAGYSNRYFIPFASSLETATGDGRFFALPGVSSAASYQMHVMGPGPAYEYFNWADSSTDQETLAMLLAIAGRFGDKAAAFTLRDRLDVAAPKIAIRFIDEGSQDAMEFSHALIYFTDIGALPDRELLPLDIALPDKKIVLMRSSWSNANASFVGFKACNCSWNHGDLDAGTLVYSWGGQRWITDLGFDDYTLPEYFGHKRFTYYRKNSFGHSTLSFNKTLQVATDCGGYSIPGPLPPVNSATFLSSFSSLSGTVFPAPADHPLSTCLLAVDEQACATIDLSPAYQGLATKVSRRIALRKDGSLLISDQWAATAEVGVAVAFQTYADVTLSSDGAKAFLSIGGRTLSITLQGSTCSGAALVAYPVHLHPIYPYGNLTRIEVAASSAQLCTAFDVLLEGVI